VEIDRRHGPAKHVGHLNAVVTTLFRASLRRSMMIKP
jgi:hypothetical protein